MTDFLFESIRAGPDGAHILASWCGVLFSVSVNVTSMPESEDSDTPTQRMTRLLQRLVEDRMTDQQYDEASQHVIFRVICAGCYLLRGFIARFRSAPVSPYLGDHLFLPVPFLRYMDAADGSDTATLEFVDGPNQYFPEEIKHAHPGADRLNFDIDPDLDDFHVNQVHVLESLVHDPAVDHVACKVLVDGQEMFCKAERGGIAFGNSVVGKDFETMLQIRAALKEEESAAETAAAAADGGAVVQEQKTSEPSEPLPLRVPSLRGVIRHPVEGHVIGFLRDWVPGASLASYDMEDVSVEQRAAWDKQVAVTICQLHDFRAYWGAADNESVIIDGDGEAWVVDFGARVNLGLRREKEDAREGDWEDYEDVYNHMQIEYVPVGSEEETVEETRQQGDKVSEEDVMDM